MAETEKAQKAPTNEKAPATENTPANGNAPAQGANGNEAISIFPLIDVFVEMAGNPKGWPKPGEDLCSNEGLDAETKYLYYHKNVGYGAYVDINPTYPAKYCRFDGSYKVDDQLYQLYDEVANAYNTLLATESIQGEQKDIIINAFNKIGIDLNYVHDVFKNYHQEINGPVLAKADLEKTYKDTEKANKVINRNIMGGSKGFTDYLNTIMQQCSGKYNQIIEDDFYDEKINFVKYCEVEPNAGANGKQIQCKDIIREGYFSVPYSKWDPELCKSECVKKFDDILRKKYEGKTPEFCNKSMFYTGCEFFTSAGGNPLDNSCGTEYDPNNSTLTAIFGGDNTSSEDNSKEITSGATTITSQIPLLTLIICIIFAFFK